MMKEKLDGYECKRRPETDRKTDTEKEEKERGKKERSEGGSKKLVFVL